MASYERNLLLRTLPAHSAEELAKHLTVLSLPIRTVLYAAGDQVKTVYFPLDGVASVTTVISGSIGEVATVGQEGLVGLPAIFGTRVEAMKVVIQIAGEVASIPVEEFEELMRTDVSFRGIIFKYLHVLYVQMGQSVVCNQRHTLRQRCARWLLMTHDRVAGDEFRLTHEFLAVMLGVRRAGVTVAAGALQRAGLIRYRRGLITILNRSGLEHVSCECYGIVRDQFESVIGPLHQAAPELPADAA